MIVHANRKAREILGTEDPIGKTVDEFIPQDYKSLKATYDSVYKDAKTHIDREVIVNSINARGEKIEGVFRRIIQPYRDLAGNITGTSDLPSWLRRFPCNRALIEQTGADFGLVAPELAVLRPPTPDFGQTRPHAISFLRTRNKLPRANSVKSCARFLARPR